MTGQLNLQATAFNRLTDRLKGIVEDDIRGGQTTSLVRQILGVDECYTTDHHVSAGRSPDRGFDEAIKRIRKENPPKPRH